MGLQSHHHCHQLGKQASQQCPYTPAMANTSQKMTVLPNINKQFLVHKHDTTMLVCLQNDRATKDHKGSFEEL